MIVFFWRNEMTLTSSYLITTKNLETIINSVVSAKAPERFTNKFLEDLGFKSSNDRLYVAIFKALGLIDDSGIPTQRYYQFIDQTQTGYILAQGIEEAYEDLFNLNKNAQELSIDEVKNKLKTITLGQKTDKVLGLMANTFKSLCAIAEWNKKTKKVAKQETQEKSINDTLPTPINSTENLVNNRMNLHYNIQIHLPETTNLAVYDAIFQSLKKHLM